VSEAQHLEYHCGFKGFCIRCDLQERRKIYDACSLHKGNSWLSRGVGNGLWGLGCRVCAEYMARPSSRTGASTKFSKFAKYGFRPTVTSRFLVKQIIERRHRSTSHLYAAGQRKRKSADECVVPPAVVPQPLACPSVDKRPDVLFYKTSQTLSRVSFNGFSKDPLLVFRKAPFCAPSLAQWTCSISPIVFPGSMSI
jgi:hypothetical protein